MTTTTRALATPSPSAPFEATEIQLRDLRDDDLLVDVKAAGICHSDIHQVREEWGSSIFPMVPGHEITGVVAKVGSGVTRYAVGDRVGIGCMVDSCGECEFCKDGEEQFCTKGNVPTYNGRGYDGEPTTGGYAQQVVVSERFAVRVPEALGFDVAAPLLCAGITTWTPLRRWGAGPGTQVAVVGLGGLGHMAVKLAAALGAEVTVVSRSEAKRDDAMQLGASDYVATGVHGALKKQRGRFDIVVNTVSANLPLDSYLRTLRPTGVMTYVGLPAEQWTLRPGSLVGGSRVLAGSTIGGIPATQEVLDFCSEHGLGATIETISAERAAAVDEAYERVVAGDVRYRFVIDVSTIPAA